jgi:hypothetical protein
MQQFLNHSIQNEKNIEQNYFLPYYIYNWKEKSIINLKNATQDEKTQFKIPKKCCAWPSRPCKEGVNNRIIDFEDDAENDENLEPMK